MSDRRLKILWIKSGFLHPIDTGGKLRTYNMLKELKKRHHITFLTLKPADSPAESEEKAREYSDETVPIPWKETPKFTAAFYGDLMRNLTFSNLPYAIAKYRSAPAEEMIRRFDRQGYDVLVCDFLAPSVNINGKLETPAILFQHNVESEIWRRHYETKTGLVSRAYFREQWKRMRVFEKKACEHFDGVVTVSPQDSEMLRRDFHLSNILGDVPTGVDVSYFHPFDRSLRRQNHLVFTGSMDWLPNEDAVFYFTKEIYPRIKSAIPDCTFTIAGRNPTGKIRELERADASVHVTGTVEDIRPFVASAAAIVVPLRIGGGTRIKIFEAMAMGIPIVSTSVGAEGLPVVNHENIVLADHPGDFARATIDLVENPKQAERLSFSALRMVKERYSWAVVSEIFEGCCTQLLERRTNG